MRLLFDQNLSFRLCAALADLFPDSSQVRLLGLDQAEDRVIWDFAKAAGFVLVSQDADFAERAVVVGPPPKVIWLRCGNQQTSYVAELLRAHADLISSFEMELEAACLEIY